MYENSIFVNRYRYDEKIFPINEEEIWRYAGYRGIPGEEEEALKKLLQVVIQDLEKKLSYKVCYRRMPLEWKNSIPQLPFDTESKELTRCLKRCDEIIIFAATIGLEIDRYIAKNQRFATTKALLAQAYGAERIESLCNAFCKEIGEKAAEEGKNCTARYSPGYGDLSLGVQKDIFQLLDCGRQIGISLNESLLMTPSKSVTAIFGIGSKDICVVNKSVHKCENCNNAGCQYRMNG